MPIFGFSQAPQKINFQSILRNTNGEVVANKSVSLKISILSGSIGGSAAYSEIHTKTTDPSGLISLQIGNGTVLSGVFANIAWGDFPHFIKLEADFSGGNNYVLLGTQELMSVPYALYASKTDTSSLNLVNRFNSKVNISDTSNMLSNYRTGLNSKVNIADTSNMLSNYRTGLNEKVNVSDTSTMLSNYRTGLNEKVNVSDTSTMLNPYLRKASIQNSTLELFGIHSWEYPEGFSKEIVLINSDNIPYTVPLGKRLYTLPTISIPIINNVGYRGASSLLLGHLFDEGSIISGFVTSMTYKTLTGFLVSRSEKITPIKFVGSYSVPQGKILILKGGGEDVFVGNQRYHFSQGGVLIFPENTTILDTQTINFSVVSLGFTGYLLDK